MPQQSGRLHPPAAARALPRSAPSVGTTPAETTPAGTPPPAARPAAAGPGRAQPQPASPPGPQRSAPPRTAPPASPPASPPAARPPARRLRLAAAAAALALALPAAPPRPAAAGATAEVAAPPPAVAAPAAPPRRVISLDYCADQFVLRFTPRDAIAGLSPDAEADFSYLRDLAPGLPRVRPRAEDVLSARADLVVRSYGGGPRIAQLLGGAGLPVLQVGWAGSIEAVRGNIRAMAAGLGAPGAGETAVAEMDARLAAAAPPPGAPQLTALYVTTGGFTAGTGTLVDDMFRAAGLRNLETRPGWRPLPLERLARVQPDIVAAAFFEASSQSPDPWSSSRHPVTRALLQGRPTAKLEGAWTSCGGWFLADAVVALAATRDAALAARGDAPTAGPGGARAPGGAEAGEDAPRPAAPAAGGAE